MCQPELLLFAHGVAELVQETKRKTHVHVHILTVLVTMQIFVSGRRKPLKLKGI